MFPNASTSILMQTKKHISFVSEPIGLKPVYALPGIGDILGNRLIENGFYLAYIVLGQFLVLKKDEEFFVEWLKQTCSANSKQAGDCYTCLKTWCDSFL